MCDTIKLTLIRDKPGPWGIRLQGGVDFEKALTVVVTEGTFSYNSGLRTGDVIVGIGNLEAGLLTHKQAQDAIIAGGNNVDLVIQRFSSGPKDLAPGTWKPSVEVVGDPATCPASPGQTYTKTSLTINSQPPEEHWDVKYNSTPKGFQTASATGPKPFSSVSAPSGIPNPGVGNNDAGNPTRPPGFKSVSAPMTKVGGSSAPSGPPQPQICWICNKPVTGVFLQAKGRPLHPDCFSCSECGTSLKNVGHFVIGDKLYCQIHAREAQNKLMGGNYGSTTGGPANQQGSGGGMPQGLTANLAKLSMRGPNGSAANANSGPVPPTMGPGSAPAPSMGPGQAATGDWKDRLETNTAGNATNAEDFTKEFMKQLTGGM